MVARVDAFTIERFQRDELEQAIERHLGVEPPNWSPAGARSGLLWRALTDSLWPTARSDPDGRRNPGTARERELTDDLAKDHKM
jgi:hypothetical protein